MTQEATQQVGTEQDDLTQVSNNDSGQILKSSGNVDEFMQELNDLSQVSRPSLSNKPEQSLKNMAANAAGTLASAVLFAPIHNVATHLLPIRRNAEALAQVIKKNVIPNPSMLDKELLDMETKIATLAGDALIEFKRKLATIQDDEKLIKLEKEQLNLLINIVLTSVPLACTKERIKKFLEDTFSRNPENTPEKTSETTSQILKAVKEFCDTVATAEQYCSPTYFIGLPEEKEHSNQMQGYVNNLISLNLHTKVEEKDVWTKEAINTLQGNVDEFRSKHRITQESGQTAMQAEQRKGLLAAIGWACLGVTLGITLGGLGFLAGAAVGTLLTGGNAGAGVVGGLGIGGLIVAAITAVTYRQASKALEHADEAKAQAECYKNNENPQDKRAARQEARETDKGLDATFRGIGHFGHM